MIGYATTSQIFSNNDNIPASALCFNSKERMNSTQAKTGTLHLQSIVVHSNTVKCRCNERQCNEMFRIAKLFLGPFPFPYLMCVKTFQFNEF